MGNSILEKGQKNHGKKKFCHLTNSAFEADGL